MLERTDIGDTEAICDDGGCSRASATGARAVLDDIADDQKISGKPHVIHDPQLVFDSFDNRLCQFPAVAFHCSFVNRIPQTGSG